MTIHVIDSGKEGERMKKFLCLNLVFSVFFLTLPSQGWTMFIPSGQTASTTQADMVTIQKTLESAMVKQRLIDHGLTSEEALARVTALSDQQIHEVASNLESLQAGADGVGALIFIVVVAILVVVVLQATGHSVIIK